jgi:hypothetical protein
MFKSSEEEKKKKRERREKTKQTVGMHLQFQSVVEKKRNGRSICCTIFSIISPL